ncbi:MAG: FeoB-associated Cys-rich membrane protein [Ruminococcaceae bacterium]|nr:FeoB-associated Cys-rich membrane protein [Oscillospiraceae bacterium]
MNWPTIIVAAVVLAVFLAIVITGIRNKKKGKSSCSCGCSECGMKGQCHPEQGSK